MSRNKDKGNGVDANFGEDGLKKNGAAKQLLRGKNKNIIETRLINIKDGIGQQREKKSDKDKVLDEEVLKKTQALHHQMQNEESSLTLDNKFMYQFFIIKNLAML